MIISIIFKKMLRFRKKNIITVKSLGEDLERARKGLNLSLKAIEKRIGVAEHYLEALENNDFEVLPGEVYAKNWLKKYAGFLGLNWDEIKLKFQDELKKQAVWPVGEQKRFGVTRKRFLVMPRIIRNIVLILVVLAVVGYLGSQVWSLLSPPSLEVFYPVEDYASQNSFIKIMGRVEKGAKLELNGNEIAADSQGWFSVDMDLNTGLNIIKIEAEKSYGRSRIVYRRIMVEDSD